MEGWDDSWLTPDSDHFDISSDACGERRDSFNGKFNVLFVEGKWAETINIEDKDLVLEKLDEHFGVDKIARIVYIGTVSLVQDRTSRY
jgi:hypothetical protein